MFSCEKSQHKANVRVRPRLHRRCMVEALETREMLSMAQPYATVTSLASSADPAMVGQSVTFTAEVGTTSAGGTPTGSVLFEDGRTILGARTLDASGVATLTTSALAWRSHSITAVYVGDVNDAGSTSAVLTQEFGNTLLVVRPPIATPNPVTGKTTNLSALGSDTAVPESRLTYTWAATKMPTGATPPSFSANGTSAARNTTATFSVAGNYTLTVTIADPEGLIVKSSARVVVDQALSSIAITPASATLKPQATQQFKAIAEDQFNYPLTTQPMFTWSTTIGTIDQSGLLTATATAGTGTVTARVGSLTGSALVAIAPPLKATPLMTVADAGGTYDGLPFPATVTLKGSDGVVGTSLEGVTPTVTYCQGNGCSSTPPTQAGAYTVTANFAGSADYAAATSTRMTFTIAKATPTVSVTDAGGTYNGSPFPATVTVKGVSGSVTASLEGVTPTVTYCQGSSCSSTPPTQAGTYTATADFPGSADYAAVTSTPVTFTIAKATPTVSVTDAGGTYNGSPFPATVTVKGVSGSAAANLEGVTPTVTYCQGSSCSSTPPTQAGTYTVTADFPGSTDYAAVTSTPVTFTIAPGRRRSRSSTTVSRSMRPVRAFRRAGVGQRPAQAWMAVL